MYKHHSSYLQKAFQDPNDLLETAKRRLDGVDYDTMVGTGTSGLLVVPWLARAMDKEFAIVRKENDNSHSECTIEGAIGDRWIFVDDFVSSGRTKQRVLDAVKQGMSRYDFETRFVGTYSYHYGTFDMIRVSALDALCQCESCEYGRKNGLM